MATKANKEEVKETKGIIPYSDDDKVEIQPLFLDDNKYSAPVCVIVNGKATYIKRGVSGLKVNRAVAEVLAQSDYQNQMANKVMKENEGVKNQGEF